MFRIGHIAFGRGGQRAADSLFCVNGRVALVRSIHVNDNFKREQRCVNRYCPSTAANTGREEARSEESRTAVPSHLRVGCLLTAGRMRHGKLHPVGRVIGAALFTDAIMQENKFSV